MSTELTAAEEDAITLTIDTEEPTLNVAPLEAAEELVPEDLRRHGANCDAEMERLRAKVARVEALAERYESEAERHRNAETITIGDGDRAWRAAQWVTRIATSIRAALAEPERDEESL